MRLGDPQRLLLRVVDNHDVQDTLPKVAKRLGVILTLL